QRVTVLRLGICTVHLANLADELEEARVCRDVLEQCGGGCHLCVDDERGNGRTAQLPANVGDTLMDDVFAGAGLAQNDDVVVQTCTAINPSATADASEEADRGGNGVLRHRRRGMAIEVLRDLTHEPRRPWRALASFSVLRIFGEALPFALRVR